MYNQIPFSTFPRTEPPPEFTYQVVSVFQQHSVSISTNALEKGFKSDEVLAIVRDELVKLGFDVEGGKLKKQLIERPVFYGENGNPTLRYKIDAYHPTWRCAMEIEAGRAWMGNAVYRDLIQASVMVHVDHLILAVPQTYKYKSSGRETISHDYENTKRLAEVLYSHTRLKLPYSLIVIGY